MIRRVPTFQACKSSLYRSRAKTTPKLPSSQEEINIDGPLSRTLAGERFLLCTDILSYARHNFLKQKNVRVLNIYHCYYGCRYIVNLEKRTFSDSIPPLHFRFPALPLVASFALTLLLFLYSVHTWKGNHCTKWITSFPLEYYPKMTRTVALTTDSLVIRL